MSVYSTGPCGKLAPAKLEQDDWRRARRGLSGGLSAAFAPEEGEGHSIMAAESGAVCASHCTNAVTLPASGQHSHQRRRGTR